MLYHFDHWEIDNNFDKIFKERKTIKNTKNKKQVRYSNIVKVILIPTNQEYIDAGIELWNKINK